MELLSNALAHASVPDKYVFPPDKRAALQLDGRQNLDHDDGVTLPVVDLHHAALSGDDGLRRRVAAEIVRAGKEFGFFQVVNHGVGEDVVKGFRDAAAEFFVMPAEEKLPYCSDDQSKPFRLASSTSYDKSETRYWRDYLKLQCHPVTDDLLRHWPPEPTTFRPRLASFSEAVHELAQTLLALVAEGLGLVPDFFAGDLSGGETQMNVTSSRATSTGKIYKKKSYEHPTWYRERAARSVRALEFQQRKIQTNHRPTCQPIDCSL